MPRPDPYRLGLLALGVLATGAVVALALAIRALQAPPVGPQPIAWGQDACAFCRMHISEPAFAAQLHTRDGEVLSFDDPGCLFHYLDRERPEIGSLWFRHWREPRWLSQREVRFVLTAPVPTPMAYGLGAADARAASSVSLEQAMARVLRQRTHAEERP